jgi:2-methylfumaryl-CoA hydratase
VTGSSAPVLTFVRWVMVRKRDAAAPVAAAEVPHLPAQVEAAVLGEACPAIEVDRWDDALAGSALRFEDYKAGDRIDHVDGMTVEEAEHMLATRLYQNTARVHFNALSEAKGRFGRRLVYGGHVMSLARALSFNGLANAFHIAAINGGRHAAPLFAGGTVFAWSEILEAAEIPVRSDVGALRIMTRASRDLPCGGFPRDPAEGDQPGIILELDYWALIPRRRAA